MPPARGSNLKRTKTAQRKTRAGRKSTARAGGRRSEVTSSAIGKIKQPKSPMPKQHQEKPGLESRVKPRPRYQAPLYKGSGKLDGKVALITGGDSGIGRAVAVLFAREGADVAITHLPEEEGDAKETKRAIENEGGRALIMAGDLCEEKFCRKAVDKTIDNFGQLDILVNNAAYQHGQEKLEDI